MTPSSSSTRLPEILKTHEQSILAEWMKAQAESVATRRDLMSDVDLQRQSREFLTALVRAAEGGVGDLQTSGWQPVREFLDRISQSGAEKGVTPSETATFVLSLKEPLFARLREEVKDVRTLADETWSATKVLDALGLYTTETYLKTRERIIMRQQEEMLELSTPVVTLWEGILALPLIGTLDSARTQVIMESLLQRIVETGSLIAILDITGVPTVDTLVAQHLLKTVAAARLMGADCIISGIRPQIAQTIVHLGVDLNSVVTKATLADAFAIALKRNGLGVTKVAAAAPVGPPTANGPAPAGV